MSAPYYYDYINKQNSTVKPSTVHIHNTGLSMFFKRYLLQRAISVFKWKLPETWSKDYFLYSLYCWGYVAIVNTDKFGVIPQACGLSGYDVFYQPTNAIIANPLLRGTLQPKIGKECTLIKLQPDYGNVMGLVDYYGDLYGQELRLEFCAYLRPEKKFPSTRELHDQIAENIREAASLVSLTEQHGKTDK